MLRNPIKNESVGWLDLHTVGTPPELGARRWVALSNQIDPECFGSSGLHDRGLNPEPFLLSGLAHHPKRAKNVINNYWRLNESIGRNDMYGLVSLLARETLKGQKDELCNCAGVLAATVANNPRPIVGEIDLLDLRDEIFQ